MGAHTNAAPVIVKRKKVVKGGGHHGGAWKVAYADFVTAMMAFFMLMWLLNATTEKQRKGLADYFSPTIAIARVSGGGAGAFGGDSVFSEETLPQNGTGASSERPTDAAQARGSVGMDTTGKGLSNENELATIDAALRGLGGESQVLENALRHIVTRVTDEGLVIEIFALEDSPLFHADSADPTPLLRTLADVVAEAARLVSNRVAVAAHTSAYPVVVRQNTAWEKTATQATQMRLLLENAGMTAARIERVTGYADRKPAVQNPMAVRNDRIEITLLRVQ